ncbi:MAG: type II toxin-antitoxin system ParD family antitoxin [Salinisphaera sp.]|nr:type II toxin-antitoxin system ParD family antitoxin [Salinisphaera sp.]
MATVRKTITVTEQQNAWINSQIQDGRFASDSELVRALIRNEQDHRAEQEAVKQALIAGEHSGDPESFDFDGFVQRKRALHGD